MAAVTPQVKEREEAKSPGSSYLLAGVLSIKLWFMQIMRVQKLVCPEDAVDAADGTSPVKSQGVWVRLLWPCCERLKALTALSGWAVEGGGSDWPTVFKVDLSKCNECGKLENSSRMWED